MNKRFTPFILALLASVLAANAQFSPTNLPGLVLWLDATDVLDGGNPSEGAAIGVWNDKSGGGHDGVQATSTSQPYYVTNGITRADGQGRPVVRFNSDWMESGTLHPGTGSVHAFVVSQRSAAQLGGDTHQRLLSTSDGNDGYDWKIPDWVIISAYDGSGTSLEYGPGIDTQKRVGVSIVDLNVGRDAATGGSRLRGDIAEVLVFTNQLAGLDLSNLLDYLDEKWISGVPDGPYFREVGAMQEVWSPSVDLLATLKGTAADVSVCWD